MGKGWRRAFCTSVRRDPEVLGGAHSSPSTPRNILAPPHSPALHCKTSPSAATPLRSGSASARASSSPSRFNLFKAALRLSRNRCGICAGSVRTGGQKAAVFTAQCSHSFHIPCISAHVRSQRSLVICPVCSDSWQEVPLLSSSSSVSAPFSSPSTPKSQAQPRDRRTSSSSSSNANSSRTKIYNDDESLLQLSPTAQFNPIPEEFEAEDEDNEASDAIGPDFITLDTYSAFLVSTSKTHLSYVVPIKLKAPKIPPLTKNSSSAVHAPLLDHPSCRAPVDLVTVLDASGSMTPAKLQMLKRAMRLLVSSLGPGDRLSIVAFSAVAAKRLLPLRRMSRPGQRSARQIVDRLVLCGSSQAQPEPIAAPSSSKSCVGDALRKATKVLEDRRERNPVATIMLLSDVHDQQQMSSSSGIQGTRFTHVEIPVSGVAQQQKQGSLPPLTDENAKAFAKSVNGLVSVVLQDVHLSFALPSASGALISSIYSYSGGCIAGIARAMAHGEGGRSVRVGDVFADEERQLLVEIKVPKSAVADGEHSTPIHLSATCSYRDPVTRDVVRCSERPITVPMPLHCRGSSPGLFRLGSSSSPLASSLEQLQVRSVFVTVRATAESHRLVKLGDLDTAAQLLTAARSLLVQQSSNSAVLNCIKKLIVGVEAEIENLQRRRKRLQQQKSFSPSIRRVADGRGGDQPLTPTSAWRAAEQLAKVAIIRKSLNRVSDLHGLENARF